jgi:hypothetical protein
MSTPLLVEAFEVEDASVVMDRRTLFRRQCVLVVETNDADADLIANEYCIVEME